MPDEPTPQPEPPVDPFLVFAQQFRHRTEASKQGAFLRPPAAPAATPRTEEELIAAFHYCSTSLLSMSITE